MFEVFLALLPLGLAALVLGYHRTLYRALALAPPGQRAFHPGLVWLGLLPFLGLLWHLVLLVVVLAVLRRHPVEAGQRLRPAALTALAALGLPAALLVGSATLPLVGPGLIFLGAPVWLLFWALVAGRVARLRGATGSLPRWRRRLLWCCLFLLGLAAAGAVVSDLRLTIWSDSGLWDEPLREIRLLREERRDFLLAACGLVLLALALGVWAATPKRLVLFLRRFRQEEINRALQHAVRRRLHRSFRLLTLDDAAFHPITSQRAARIGTALALVAAAAVLLGTRSLVQSYLAEGLRGWAQVEGLISSSAMVILVMPLLMARNPGEMQLQLPEGLVAKLAHLYGQQAEVCGAYFSGFGTAYFGIGLFLAAAGVLYGLALLRLRWAGRRAVVDMDALARLQARLLRLRGRLFAPSLAWPAAAVVATDSAVWQAAVLRLAETADVVLFDVSDASENIAWEIDQMFAAHAPKVVLVAQRQRLQAWTAAAAAAGADAAWQRRAARVLAGQPILYDRPEDLDLRELARRLRPRA